MLVDKVTVLKIGMDKPQHILAFAPEEQTFVVFFLTTFDGLLTIFISIVSQNASACPISLPSALLISIHYLNQTCKNTVVSHVWTQFLSQHCLNINHQLYNWSLKCSLVWSSTWMSVYPPTLTCVFMYWTETKLKHLQWNIDTIAVPHWPFSPIQHFSSSWQLLLQASYTATTLVHQCMFAVLCFVKLYEDWLNKDFHYQHHSSHHSRS